MKTRRIPLIIGLVLALGTGALLLGYLTSLRSSTSPGQTKPVLVAVRDIPARAAATIDLFTVQRRDAAQVDSDAISDAKDLAGTYTLVAIPAGSVATRSKIGTASAATLPARLPVGMRAASISIDNVKGVAGLITPGDRVDVIAVPPAAAGETPRGSAILRGVIVLAMGSNVETGTTAPGPLGVPAASLTTVTLALTPDQVDRLAGADLTSTLRLALRNPKEPADSLPSEVLKLATQSGPPAVTPVAAPPVAAPQPAAGTRPSSAARRGVIVIDGDRVDPGQRGVAMSARIFVVVGAKGGVGATTLSIKLIQRLPALAERMIVDADLAGKRSVAVCYDLSDELDVARVIGAATVATKGGTLVMELARTYEDGLIQTTGSITRTLADLSAGALVVVDAPQPLAATVRPFIARATRIIVVTEPTRMGVGVAGSVLASLARAGIPGSRIVLATVDISGTGELKRSDVEQSLGLPVSVELPHERDRRYEGLLDGFVTMLNAAPPWIDDPNHSIEKPVFERRAERGRPFG